MRLQPFFDYYEPRVPRAPSPRFIHQTSSSTEPVTIHVECVEAAALVRYQTAWADLCMRVLEPNVFLEPAFALPLIQHVRTTQRPSYILVWEESGPSSFGRLLGLLPIELRRREAAFDRIALGFAHKQTSSGTPLVDREHAAVTLDAMLGWLAARDARFDALALKSIIKDGPFHLAIRAACERSSRRLVELDTHLRAVLRRHDDRTGATVLLANAKRRKERGRQFRRLSEIGTRAYTTARTPAEVARATERFLALEHNGWKGARRTALLAVPTLATFARTMTRLMAHEGKCRIDSIEIDGKPVAMGIVIQTADRAYFWKTAFDETYAQLSPGVQFAMDLTRAQLADPCLAFTDSCAVANHPMIDRLWPERITITDLILSICPGDDRRFTRSLGIERLRRGARERAKTLWHRLLGRQRRRTDD